jgi:glucose/arabinose dehydrogenase
MNIKTRFTNCAIALVILSQLLLTQLACSEDKGVPQTELNAIKLPPGFRISLYAEDIEGARSMTQGSNGTLFVSTRDDKVYALVDTNRDFRADIKYTIASGLFMPNGVAFRDGSLFVAEINRVLRYDSIETHLSNPPEPAVITTAFPSDTWHGWKFIRFGPDGKLYIPIGMPCNVCEQEDQRYGTIMRMNTDGTGLEVFARGIRNTVGFDWHPDTHELWFTDNGRDMLGDDIPPDELNNAPTAGMHFGFPYCHAGTILDPDFGAGKNCMMYTPPVQRLGPHVASLGMRFYTGKMFPPEYQNRIFIAEHGSWNRSTPIGYRITTVKLDGNKSVGYEVFAEGWLTPSGPFGRPVDIEQLPDGSLLVSDDHGGKIYRITYSK